MKYNQLLGHYKLFFGFNGDKLSFSRGNINLAGHIPKEIGNLVNLVELQLEANHLLNGSLPKEIGNMTALNYLLLNDNDLSGMIFICIFIYFLETY